MLIVLKLKAFSFLLFVNSSQLSSHLVVYALCKVGNRHGGLFAATLLTHGHGAVGSLFLTHHNHVRHALELVVTNLAANLLVAVVDESTHASGIELGCYLAGIVVILLRDRQNRHLIRCEPQGEVAGCVLYVHGCEALSEPKGAR